MEKNNCLLKIILLKYMVCLCATAYPTRKPIRCKKHKRLLGLFSISISHVTGRLYIAKSCIIMAIKIQLWECPTRNLTYPTLGFILLIPFLRDLYASFWGMHYTKCMKVPVSLSKMRTIKTHYENNNNNKLK